MVKIGIIGGGFVGSATALLASENVDVIVYDLDPSRCVPSTVKYNDILSTEAVFICVPTPITTREENYGMCNTKIVESVITQLKFNNYKGHIIVRSTVPVGFCKSYGVFFMPEFLTEKNWRNDFLHNDKGWVIGDDNDNTEFRSWFLELILLSPVTVKKVTFTTTGQAEFLKYVRNCFLATKVSFFNEIESFATASGIDYQQMLPLIVEDARVGASHTAVPGHDGKKGFGGTCFPKDMASLQYQMKEKNVASHVINAAIFRNEHIDRPEKDWL